MNKKQSFWVIKNEKPQLIEGELIPEPEGAWCEGEDRFHELDGHYYVSWFDSPEEAIKYEIEMAQHKIEFEKEMFEEQLKSLEKEKQYWVDIYNNQHNKSNV